MRALRFTPSKLRYGVARVLGKRAPVWMPRLDLVQLEPPTPPPSWRTVRVRLAGVCGSDLGILFGRVSLRLTAYVTLPAVFGHEIVGEVDGTRVAVEPTLACADRGLPACGSCARGDEHLCVGDLGGRPASGLIGYDRDLPGGWSEAVVARDARLHPLPDDVPDERAVLAEPLAVAVRGVRRLLAQGTPRRLLLIGSGSLGLLAIHALRRSGFDGELHVAARYGRQGEAARGMGADRVHQSPEGAARAVGARPYRTVLGPPAWRGGFDATIDAAGTRSSLAAASWATTEGGTVLLLGGADYVLHDFSPHWYREVGILGSYIYARGEFAEAVAMLSGGGDLDALAPTRFALEAHRDALAAIRSRRVLKAAFDPSLGTPGAGPGR